MGNGRQERGRRLELEVLEQRIAPAGSIIAVGDKGTDLGIAVVTIGNGLTLGAKGGDNVITADSLTVNSGSTVITTGAGADEIDMDVSDLGGALTINTGAGNDAVNLDTESGSGFISVYGGVVKISLGAGDDALFMGNSDLDGNHGEYHAAVLLDGGPGLFDGAVYEGTGNTFAVNPLPKGFEIV